jgi:thiazole/oxazole-forming peptide maturase SagD family component
MLQLAPLDLDAGPGAALFERVRATSPKLAAVAHRLARAFVIGSPFAPGLCCIGAELALDPEAAAAYAAPRISVTGNGETLEAALISCLGEAVDRLAVVERAGDVRTEAAHVPDEALAGTWMAQAIEAAAAPLDWIEAREAATGRVVALPADLCLRRAPKRRRIAPVGALSTGVAAGPDFEAAAVRGALELIERDAAALWWLGGRVPRAFPLEHPASSAGTQLIGALRRDRIERQTLLLDITTDLEVPVIAAVSLASDGRGLACGFGARLDWAGAARAAIFEMCQMELAAPLAEAKRAERGEGALNDLDRRHLQRAAYHAADCALLQPRELSPLPPHASSDLDLRAFADAPRRRGIRSFVVDLTRPEIGIAAARFVAPALQPYAEEVMTDRLRNCRAASGGVYEETAAVPLM